jgi:chromosome segregation ATPase
LKTTLTDLENRLTVHDAKLTKIDPKIQKLIEEAKKQADDQNTAKEARAVIRKDLKQLMDTMYVEDGKLRCQIDDQTKDLKMKYSDLQNILDRHEVEQQSLESKLTQYEASARDRHDTTFREIGSKMEVAQSDFHELKKKVEEHTEAQGLANEARAAIRTDLQKLAETVKDQNEKLACKIEEDVADLKAQQSELKVVLDTHEAEQQALVAKLDQYNTATSEQQETMLQEIGAKIDMAQSNVDDLKSVVEKQADDQNTAKKARVVIRSDLKQLMETMHAQDGKLRRLIEEQAAYLKEKRSKLKALLAKHETAQLELEAKLELYNTAAREQHETMLRNISAKLDAAQSYSDELLGKVEQQQEGQRLADEGLITFKSDLEKLSDTTKDQNEKLASQIQKHVTDLYVKQSEMKAILDKHEAEQQEFEGKLEQYHAAANEYQEVTLLDIGVKMDETQSNIGTLQSEVQQLSQEQIALSSAQEQFKENTEKVLEAHTALHKDHELAIEQQASTLKAATAELHTILERNEIEKAELEQGRETFRGTVQDRTVNSVQEMELKLARWTSQFDHLVSQMAIETDESRATKQQVETVQTEMEKLTETQTTQFELLLTQVCKQAEDLKETKASILGKFGERGLAEQLESLASEFETLLQQKEAASKASMEAEAVTKAHFESLVGEIQQQLNQLKSTLDEVKASRDEEPQFVDARETSDEESAQEIMDRKIATLLSQFEGVLQQVQQQATEVQSVKDERKVLQATMNQRVEDLNRQLQDLLTKVEQQAEQVQQAQEERELVQKELESTREHNMGLTVKVVGMKEKQLKYKADFRKRQGQLKELMAVSNEIKRDVVCYPIEEESREAEESSACFVPGERDAE